MLRILALTKYGDRAASARQRFLQYRPYLDTAELSLEVTPLLDNHFLDTRFSGGGIPIGDTAKAYFRRMRQLSGKTECDAVWVQYELFPYLPAVFERLGICLGVPIVLDYDDAISHQYDAHRLATVRYFLGQKLEYLIGKADTVVCGNEYIESWARRHSARTAHVPTVVDVDRFLPVEPRVSDTPVIGWMGSPSTWKFVEPILPVFERLMHAGLASIRVVGAAPRAETLFFLDIAKWCEATEVTALQSMDIGVMPVDDTPFARGKCGYKLIQYMACGLPVVASPVGVNAQIVEHGVNGFLAETEEEWEAALTTLINDPDLRQSMGQAGRRKVEAEYSLQVYGPRVAHILRGVAERGHA